MSCLAWFLLPRLLASSPPRQPRLLAPLHPYWPTAVTHAQDPFAPTHCTRSRVSRSNHCAAPFLVSRSTWCREERPSASSSTPTFTSSASPSRRPTPLRHPPHRCTPRTRAPSCTLFLQLASPISSCVCPRVLKHNPTQHPLRPHAAPPCSAPPPYTPPHACRVVHVRAVPHPAPETAPPCASRSITAAWHVPLAHFTHPCPCIYCAPHFASPVLLS